MPGTAGEVEGGGLQVEGVSQVPSLCSRWSVPRFESVIKQEYNLGQRGPAFTGAGQELPPEGA